MAIKEDMKNVFICERQKHTAALDSYSNFLSHGEFVCECVNDHPFCVDQINQKCIVIVIAKCSNIY